MPCNEKVVRRAAVLKIAAPQGLTHEEIMKLTGAVGHDEAHDKIDHMSDEEFKEFVARMEKIRKKKASILQNYQEQQHMVPAYSGAGVA